MTSFPSHPPLFSWGFAAVTLLLGVVARAVAADASSQSPSTIRLWDGDVPGARGEKPEDVPTLTAYLPDPAKRNGASMLILPGGGYGHLAEHEGKGYAEWFIQHGITSYVLKYRLGSAGYRHPIMLQDAARALRMVRAFAQRDGLDVARIGVIGSSAGGHLASTLATHFDRGNANASDEIERQSCRPDLAVLCYPVITMGTFTHNGSKTNLLGKDPAPELIAALSNELQVTSETPPCFIWSTYEDGAVPVENSLQFVAALRKANVPLAFHIYEKGGHGLGMGRPGKPGPPWTDALLYWFNERGFVGR